MDFVIKQIPNALTTLRLVLAAPICFYILKEDYDTALGITFIAGVSDAIDGWLARKLNCISRYGSVVDPISDKVLLIGSYLCFAVVGLLPWWMVATLAARDGLIVTGAFAFKLCFGPYKVAPSLWGKACTFAQITFALAMLTRQVFPFYPEGGVRIGIWTVVLITIVSGLHYGYTWGRKAVQAAKEKRETVKGPYQ